MSDIRNMQHKVHELAKEKGWWDDPRTPMECLMLIVTELAEAAEDLRTGNMCPPYVPGHKPEGFGIELADAVIRIMDLAEYMGYDLEHLMERKHEYNRTRPYKHGKKL